MGKKFKAIYNILSARSELGYIFNTSSEAQSRHNRKELISSSQLHLIALITNTEVSFENVYCFKSSNKSRYLGEMQQVHAPDVEALALTMPVQDQQVCSAASD